jgi:hypothetical protein
MAQQTAPYPVSFNVDYPDRQLDRFSTFFRILALVPILVLLLLLEGSFGSWDDKGNTGAAFGGVLVLPLMVMLLFRQKYPRWWFDWNLALQRFGGRIGAYAALLRDEYPSTDEEQAVHLDIPYPDARQLNRWLPLVKWLLAVPHYLVLTVLTLAAIVGVVVAWFAILFTGRYPRGIFHFVVGVQRWGYRVAAYAFLLVTDRYPPFSTRP